MHIVSRLFKTEDLLLAVRDLSEQGVSYDDISVVTSAAAVPEYVEGEPELAAAGGAAVGATTGGILGAWVVPSIPGFESMLATGLLTTAAGSVIGGYLGSMYSVRAESQAKIDIHEELSAGNKLLLVRTDELAAGKNAALMEQSADRDVEIYEIPAPGAELTPR